MSTLVGRDGFDALFLDDTPLLDVRAEVEYARGAFPTSVNLPILTDDERRLVGIRYAEKGPESARSLGHELVAGDTRAERIARWQALLSRCPDTHLYCFRGGERSRIAEEWLADAGVTVPRIEGGYRALRRHLIEFLERAPAELELLIVAGKTGTGKTDLIRMFVEAVDLEALAHHRGSAFGRRLDEQPSQINFENALAIELLKRARGARGQVLLEDESFLIGRRNLPKALFEAMASAPQVVLEEPLATRVDRVFREYVLDQAAEYETAANSPNEGFEAFAAYLRESLGAIERRLGSARSRVLAEAMDAALAAHKGGDPEPHKEWIEALLVDYYDPQYEYQLTRKTCDIVARGSSQHVAAWLTERRGYSRTPPM